MNWITFTILILLALLSAVVWVRGELIMPTKKSNFYDDFPELIPILQTPVFLQSAQPNQKEILSDITIYCAHHGTINLSQKALDKQNEEGKYYCPHCLKIPRKIWQRK